MAINIIFSRSESRNSHHLETFAPLADYLNCCEDLDNVSPCAGEAIEKLVSETVYIAV